jgi:hypothetical protein
MSAMNCPNCGGPAQVGAGQANVTCTFCGHAFSVAAPAPPPASPFQAPPPGWGPPPPPPPQIIVVPPGMETFTPMTTSSSFTGMRVAFGVLPVVIMLMVSGIIYSTTMRATGGSGLGAFGGWSSSSPLVCGGNDNIEASGINATFASGSVISVGGNCHVTCRGCTLKAAVAVSAGGNAEVDLVDCHIEGTDSAIIAGGNAQVRVTGDSTVVGKVEKGGNAGVLVPPTAAAPAMPAAAPKPASAPVTTSAPSPAAPSHAPSKHH